MTRAPSAALLLALTHALAASAHDVSGGLGTAAAATDLYQVTCSDDGGGAPASLRVQIRDQSPVAAPQLSVQIQKGLLLVNATDPVDGDSDFSPAVWLNGGAGGYDVLVNKTETGSETYALSFHCQTGPDGSGLHTGTSHTVKQNQ